MSSSSKRIIIKFQDGRIWFDLDHSIEIQATNLPIDHCTLTNRPFYWEISLVKFNADKEILESSITDFEPKVATAWVGVTPKSKISLLNFLNLNWEDFSVFLSSYNNSAKLGIPSRSGETESSPFHVVTLSDKIRLVDLEFGKGYVSFTKSFRWTPEPQSIKIHNHHVFPQLKLLLPYLIKLLKKKTINVTLKIGRENGQTTYIKANSTDINKINNKNLQVIRVFQLDDARKKFRTADIDNIFNPSPEILDDIILGNIDSFEKEMLFSILSKEEVRNANQLNHLSTLLPDQQKLFLTIDPQFGFVFRIEEDEMTHYIWELINSHASYIWSFPRGTSSTIQIKRLEEEFSILTQQGRSFYKASFENTTALFLNIINHSTNNNPMVDQFNTWRMKVEAILI